MKISSLWSLVFKSYDGRHNDLGGREVLLGGDEGAARCPCVDVRLGQRMDIYKDFMSDLDDQSLERSIGCLAKVLVR